MLARAFFSWFQRGSATGSDLLVLSQCRDADFLRRKTFIVSRGRGEARHGLCSWLRSRSTLPVTSASQPPTTTSTKRANDCIRVRQLLGFTVVALPRMAQNGDSGSDLPTNRCRTASSQRPRRWQRSRCQGSSGATLTGTMTEDHERRIRRPMVRIAPAHCIVFHTPHARFSVDFPRLAMHSDDTRRPKDYRNTSTWGL